MRVLFATMQFGRGYGQGTERYLTILAAGLRERGHETVVLGGDPEQRGTATEFGEVVTNDPRVLHYPTSGWMAVEGIAPELLVPVLERERPNLVHIANPAHIGLGLAPAAAGLGIPVVATVMDYWWVCPKQTLRHYRRGVCDARVTYRECVCCIADERDDSARKTLARLPILGAAVLPSLYFSRWRARGVSDAEIERWRGRQEWIARTMQAAAAVICPSRTARAMIEPRLRGPKIVSIPYGLEPHWFSRPDTPQRSGAIDPAALTIGYAGALAPHKGVHLILEALAQLKWTQTCVRIAGGGEEAYERKLRELASGLRVEFVGRVAPSEMPTFMHDCDVMIVPSLWPENLPIAVLEACAAGVPVLASRVGGIEELLDDPAATFEMGSSEALAACLARWAAEPASSSSPHVCTAAEMVAQTLALYEQLT